MSSQLAFCYYAHEQIQKNIDLMSLEDHMKLHFLRPRGYIQNSKNVWQQKINYG